jgi:hypothetical protein
MSVSDMAQIPYIEHQRRMYKAYRREKSLKVLLIGSNALWLAWAIVWLVTR